VGFEENAHRFSWYKSHPLLINKTKILVEIRFEVHCVGEGSCGESHLRIDSRQCFREEPFRVPECYCACEKTLLTLV